MQTVSYRVARIASAVISALVWAVILGLAGTAISGTMAVDGLTLAEAQGFFVVICLFIPLFTGQGAVVGMLEGLLDGRFEAPSPTTTAHDRVQSPWHHGLRLTGLLGLPAAIASYVVLPSAFGNEVDRWHFVAALAVVGAALAASASALSHDAFLRALSVPAAGRRYPDDGAGYLGRRQLGPHVLTNIAINIAVGIAIVAKPEGPWRALAPGEVVVGDTIIMAFIIAIAVFAGARTQARTDARFGVLSPGDGATRGGALRLAGWVLLCTAAAGGTAVLLLAGLGVDGLPLPAFVAFKAAVAALLAAHAAERGHRAGLAAA